jgi:hypothetical protein
MEIQPVRYASVMDHLRDMERTHPDIWQELASYVNAPEPAPQPLVQISYDEIVGEELDRLLGYAGIPKSNRPIGLVGEFPPFVVGTLGGGCLVFPVKGLYRHFSEMAPDLFNRFANCGSMDSVCKRRGEEMTVVEYLIGGVLECIKVCQDFHMALTIRW